MINKKELTEFMELVSNGFSPGESFYLHSLITHEPNGYDASSEISKLARENFDYELLETSSSEESLCRRLLDALKGGKKVLLDLGSDPDSELLDILIQSSKSSRLDLPGTACGPDARGSLMPVAIDREARVIVLARRSLIDKELSYPYFYSLFAAVINL